MRNDLYKTLFFKYPFFSVLLNQTFTSNFQNDTLKKNEEIFLQL